jgi:hypothetical protein
MLADVSSLQCTSKGAGYTYNFITNTSGVNNFVRFPVLSTR